LPNDPLFRNLTAVQMYWIISNIIQENEEHNKALNSIKSSNSKTFSSRDGSLEEFLNVFKR